VLENIVIVPYIEDEEVRFKCFIDEFVIDAFKDFNVSINEIEYDIREEKQCFKDMNVCLMAYMETNGFKDYLLDARNRVMNPIDITDQ